MSLEKSGPGIQVLTGANTHTGATTVSEELGLGQEEFVPWQLGAVT